MAFRKTGTHPASSAGRLFFRIMLWSLFRSDGIGMGLYLFVLTRFLYANRYPLRLKTL